MIASNITREALERAAARVGVDLEMRPLSASGRRWRVKVNPRRPNQYQRLSASYGHALTRRVHAVCWHGFRDFFRAAFAIAPDAIFRTAMDTWNGAEDFERRHRESGLRNIGSRILPVPAAAACSCPESGSIGAPHTEEPRPGC